MSKRSNRTIQLAARPEGEPAEDDFAVVTSDRPSLGGTDVLVKTLYVSVDPYMRNRMRDAESYAEPWEMGDVIRAHALGEVVESEHPDFAAGDLVTGRLEWAEFVAVSGGSLSHFDVDNVPLTAALSTLGMPGRTAYFGLLHVGDPTPGETVVVSGAAGAVGSIVGQIASLNGCRTVGIAGTDEKVNYVVDDLGFDAGVNYRTSDLPGVLATAVPDGVDVYFDNVGGPITDAVFERLNERARIAVCGQVALYNRADPTTGPRKLWTLVEKRALVRGFLTPEFESDFDVADARLASWVRAGELTTRTTIVRGLENAPGAFVDVMEGAKIGKQLVAVAADERA